MLQPGITYAPGVSGAPPVTYTAYGANFRGLTGNVTDGPRELAQIWAVSPAYPNGLSSLGVNAGWLDTSRANTSATRDDSLDRRLAGIVYGYDIAINHLAYRFDVLGNCRLSLAVGDTTAPHDAQKWEVWDGPEGTGTLLDSYTGGNSAGYRWVAADKQEYTAADWVNAHDVTGAAKVIYPISQYMLLVFRPTGLSYYTVAHISVEEPD